MLLSRQGFPEEEELVYCIVTNVQPHSVFVKMVEYGSSGMIHISEVSPGRIRNIRDYVKEDKIVVCKVLRINKERGHIDLSLRRVSDNQRRIKVNKIKQEQKAEKIIDVIAKDLKVKTSDLYNEISKPILEQYEYVFTAFMDVVNGANTFEKIGLSKKYADKFQEVVTTRLKPVEVTVAADIELSTYKPDGVLVIKSALNTAVESGAKVMYLTGGKYKFAVTASNYKDADKKLQAAFDDAIKVVTKAGGIGKFTKIEK